MRADVEYERALLEETREEITRADNKASILFGVFGLLIGAVVYAFLRGDWEPFDLANGIEWLWWLGAACGVTAVGLLGRAVYPAVSHPHDRDRVAFFGHVAEFETLGEFTRAIADRKGTETERLRDQIWVLSRGVALKYRCTRRAMWLFGGGTMAMAGAVLVDAVTS